jgi:hypothetical protein
MDWLRSKMTLNYQMVVERCPNLKEEVGGSNPGCEISSLLDGKLARWSTASCALTLVCWTSVSKIKWIDSIHQRVTLSTHYLNYVMKRIGASV